MFCYRMNYLDYKCRYFNTFVKGLNPSKMNLVAI